MSESDPGSSLRPLRSGSGREVAYAYIFLTALFVVPIGGTAIAIWAGYFTPDITITANPDISGPLQLLAWGLAGAAVVWVFIQLVRVAGIGFIRGLISTVARVADAYELPQDTDQES